MALIHKILWTVVILLMMNNGVAQEIHDRDNREALWFSTSTSGLLNRSSTELATKHIRRGMRLAYQALQKKLVLSDQLIANHNLCVGFLNTGKAESAKAYCARAIKLARQPFNIIKIRGAYFLSEKTEFGNVLTTIPLFQTVLSNIELQKSHMQLSLVKK